MKILLLNPQINAEHNLAKALQDKKISLLFPMDEVEAWQMLRWHGSSIDLALIHREGDKGAGEPGITLISKIKNDPTHKDLPMILTTEAWSDENCAQHQNSPYGVNAYLHSPLNAEMILETIQAVLGRSADVPVSTIPATPPEAFPVKADPSAPVLEEASGIFLQTSVDIPGDSSIQLISPEPSAEPADVVIERIGTLQLDQGTEAVPAPPQTSVDLSHIDLSAGIELSPALAEPTPEAIAIAIPEPETLAVPPLPPGLPATPPPPPKLAEVPDNMPDMSALIFQDSDSSGEVPQEEAPSEPDEEVKQEMPYLFTGSQKVPKTQIDPALLFAQPLGDAVVPGGAAQTPDLETFKKYLLLREQDVAVLSNRLKAAQDQIKLVEQILREEKAKNAELSHVANEQKRKLDEFEREKSISMESLNSEIAELRFQVKAKTDKAKLLNLQVSQVSEEMEQLKERVRADIRKIRVREKELENRLEIMKKDSEALIGARENKIIELKRKLDLLEFNMDLLQNQYSKEKENSLKLRERLVKAAQVVRVAGGLLDSKKASAIKDMLTEDGSSLVQEEESQKAS